jgi:hypothetical protein
MKKLLFLWMITGLTMLPAAGLADSISPASVTATLGVGETLTVEKTVTITEDVTTALVDVLFLVDTTGSMGVVIDAAQDNASAILSSASGLGDVHFGVARYEDFPESPFGSGGNVPFDLIQNLTANTTAVSDAIDALSPFSGGDTPESQLVALSSSASEVSWRTDSTRIIIWFGDAPGHDGDLEPGYPSDIGLADAISDLGAENIIVEAINLDSSGGFVSLDLGSPVGSHDGQATAITDATGGDLFSGATEEEIVDLIDQALQAAFEDYSEVSLEAVGNLPGVGVTIDPLAITGDFSRETETTFDFLVTFEGLEPGVHDFVINALVDGGIVATEEDLITVPGDGPAAVPEPATMLLVGSGLLGLAGLRRKFFK